MIKIAINGFGRIGRLTLKSILDGHPELEVVAINDLTDSNTLAHLFKYDSTYGIYDGSVKTVNSSLLIEGKCGRKEIKIFGEKDPLSLPWKKLGIDVVLECTGHFTDEEGAGKHLKAGAKRVVISAPAKSDNTPSFILGINEDKFNPKKDFICDMGSCTTNCLAPVAKVLNENFVIVKGFMTTIHAYTNDQNLLDLPHKDLRRARAAALSIIPTTTGAAKAIGKVIPELKGRMDGMAFRVPTPTVSVVDLVCEVKKKTTAEEVNFSLKKAAKEKRFQGILGVEDIPLVSCDYKGNSLSSIVDSSLTKAIDNVVKVISWYDNEWGYASRFADFIEFIGGKL
jgi:glyceraldehyde 3-phosphate dehydrogenase